MAGLPKLQYNNGSQRKMFIMDILLRQDAEPVRKVSSGFSEVMNGPRNAKSPLTENSAHKHLLMVRGFFNHHL